MRQTEVSGIYITYPEEIVWLHDSSVVKLEGSNVGGIVTVEEPSGNSYTMEYYSEQSELMFVLDDAITALYGDNIGTWRCRIIPYTGTTAGTQFNFTFRVYNGKSFISRGHGIQQAIYVYNPDELYKLQIFGPQQGQALVNGTWGFNLYVGLNQYNLSVACASEGTHTICLQDSAQTPNIAEIVTDLAKTPSSSDITFQLFTAELVNETTSGDEFTPVKRIFPICHTLYNMQSCQDYSFGEVRYFNNDGCIRYLGGRVTQYTDAVKSNQYSVVTNDIFKKNPSRWITGSTRTLTLSLSDIDKEAYPHDILYSDRVWFRDIEGNWMECSINNSSFKIKEEETYDIELEIIVHNI